MSGIEPGRGGDAPTWLHEQRLAAVLAAVREVGAARVLDLGCGDGAFALPLAAAPGVAEVIALDRDRAALERLGARLARAPEATRARLTLVEGCLIEAGARLAGHDAAVLVETIEHIDPERLSELERAIFARMRPGRVIVTTPNAEFNALLGVPAHRFRHPDHRFEWGRARFAAWARGVGARHGYRAERRDIGGGHPAFGGPSQMAVLDRADLAAARA